MARRIVLSVTEADEDALAAKAAQVRADIPSQYQQLATGLRRRDQDEVDRMGETLDPTERAARNYAFQLYGTAASEPDDTIARLRDSLDCLYTRPVPPTPRSTRDDGRSTDAARDRGVR